MRSIPVSPGRIGSPESAKIQGLDGSTIVGIGTIENQLITVWQNYTEAYYDDGQDPKDLEFFGVIYDLPHLDNSREFSLPGKFLGTYKNKLMVEENDDPLEYKIGYYEFED